MSSNASTSVVQFQSYELDPFDSYDDADTIAELDPIWADYADKQFGETSKNRREMIAVFKARATEEASGGLSLPDKDSFYLKILRAGGFTVEGGLRVLSAYFGHIRDCPQYFKVNSVQRTRHNILVLRGVDEGAHNV